MPLTEIVSIYDSTFLNIHYSRSYDKLRDILTDIIHLCEKKKVDFNTIVTRAQTMYGEEKNYEPKNYHP
jgi:hypothetical protein